MRNIEFLEWNRFGWSRAIVPGNSDAVFLEGRDADTPISVLIHFEERLLAHDRNLIHLRIRRIRPIPRRHWLNANEDHIPIRTGPTLPFAVARNPLLLGARIDIAVDQCVGHPTSAGPSVMLMQDQISTHVHTPEGHGL